MTITRDEDIGGGYVRRLFTCGGEAMKSGAEMTREQILAIPAANRQALIDGGKLSIYPPRPGQDDQVIGDRFMVSRGFGKYDVFEGRKVNEEALTKEEAEALLGVSAEPELVPN